MKGLPIGQDSFENLLHDNGIYVDKTEYIHKLMSSSGRTFFLSRPRRFGKSLLLNTMKAVFEGRKELFKGLYIEDRIEWEVYPVIKLDMSVNSMNVTVFEENLKISLYYIAKAQGLDIPRQDPSAMLRELIIQLANRYQKQVVVLVDEYDKPILDNIEDSVQAAAFRTYLQAFYVSLKLESENIRFLMLTGVSKINHLSIFSGLNQLRDITMDADFSGICGYTQGELEFHFDEYVNRLSPVYGYTREQTYKEIKRWYNGYSWDGRLFVYNPFSVLRLLQEKRFMGYWFATGTPTFLLKLLRQVNDYSAVLSPSILTDYGFEAQQTLENLKLAPLLFQTGYLTLKKDLPLQRTFELAIPNEEVREALFASLVNDYVRNEDSSTLYRLAGNLKAAFAKGDTAIAVEYLKVLYSNAAYHQGIDHEGYYHNLFEIFCKFAGLDIIIESRTDIGRIDSVIRFEDRTYIIEIKYTAVQERLPEVASGALAQVKRNNYIQPYLHQGKVVHLLGLAFTKGGIAYDEIVS